MNALLVVSLVLAVAGIGSAWYTLKYRAGVKQRGVFGRPWPIRKIPVEELDPIFAFNALGPSLQTEVLFVAQVGAGGGTIHGGTTDLEAWILSVLAKKSRSMFEFGTCTGKTTYSWARNAPQGAEVVTLTLGPDQLASYAYAEGDSRKDTDRALKETSHDRFYYSGTDVESRITQLFGDSKHFDETPYLGRFDLVFVDGSHARSYVESDSAKALRMCKPGGLVLWHDYAGKRIPGVFDALNELSKTLPLVHVAGTKLVAYRRPAA